MENITDIKLQYFGAWSGGKETLDTLIVLSMKKRNWKYVDELENYIEEIFEIVPTETQINDFLWFEKETIAEYFGFKNWDELFNEAYEQ